MPRILLTIAEYVATIRKKDTIFISFNTPYAKFAMNIPLDDNDKAGGLFNFLNQDKTNWAKREEFIKWMDDNYHNISIIDVFDHVPAGMQYPFLGTIAIDVKIDSPEYHAICNRYEDANGQPKSLDAVIWIISYDEAKKMQEEKKALWETELE